MDAMYQRTRLAGEENDVPEILAVLSEIRKGRLPNDLKLLNFFRQMPVNYEATVLTVEENDAELLANQVQAVVISLDRMTVLKSSHFRSDVIAKASYVNIEKSRVVLSSFSYAVVRADRRRSVRVELSDPIIASFTCPLGTVGGRLHDMSLTGIAINVSEKPEIPLAQKGVLAVTLPIGAIKVPASLLTVLAIKDGYRLAFQTGVTRATEANISQYIMRRQVEIIKELKNHPGVES
jgi:hypothetical protein